MKVAMWAGIYPLTALSVPLTTIPLGTAQFTVSLSQDSQPAPTKVIFSAMPMSLVLAVNIVKPDGILRQTAPCARMTTTPKETAQPNVFPDQTFHTVTTRESWYARTTLQGMTVILVNEDGTYNPTAARV